MINSIEKSIKVINSSKLDLIDEVMKRTGDAGFDRVCEASGHGPTLEKSFKLLKKGGKLGIVGIPKTPISIENPLPDLGKILLKFFFFVYKII